MSIKITFRHDPADKYDENNVRIMELYLFRHGYTRYNAEHRYQGKTDLPLLESERTRIHSVFEELEPDIVNSNIVFEGQKPGTARCTDMEQEVYVSPAVRARQTAELLFPGMRQIIIPEFAEMDFGIFEGRRADDMSDDPQYRSWVDSMCEAPVPQGESKAIFTDRVTERFRTLVENAAAMGRERLLIVAHGGVQMAVMDRFCEESRPFWTWKCAPGEGIRAFIKLSHT